MSAISKAISRASLSIAFGALATSIAIIAAEKLLISKLSAGLLAIGLFFVGSIMGSMFDEWMRSKKAQIQSERELITALENLMEGIPDVASRQMNKQVNELAHSIQRMKTQLAAKGIRYIPTERPFKSPPATSNSVGKTSASIQGVSHTSPAPTTPGHRAISRTLNAPS